MIFMIDPAGIHVYVCEHQRVRLAWLSLLPQSLHRHLPAVQERPPGLWTRQGEERCIEKEGMYELKLELERAVV